MTLPLLPVRRTRILCVAAYTVLIAITGIVAVRLVPFSITMGQDLWHDAQSDKQMVTSWRGSAVFAYTSGSWVGQLCALLAGLLAGRWAKLSTRGTGLGAAMAAGAGLGLTALVPAFWTAAPRLRDLAQSPHLVRESGVPVIDPALVHHGCVFAAAATAFVVFLLAAYAGFRMARADPVSRILLVPAAVLAPVAYFVINIFLV
jgi:hypothetical protein